MDLPVAVHALLITGSGEGADPSGSGVDAHRDGPWVDLYRTPWGQIMVEPDALTVTGTPTIFIPAGIPRVR